jgi:hypothetical protein
MACKGRGRLGRKLGAPWVILGLADLMRGAPLRARLALQAVADEHRVGVGIPVAALQG